MVPAGAPLQRRNAVLQPDEDERESALLAAALHEREVRLRTTIAGRQDAPAGSAWKWAGRGRSRS